jgi:hypothetical protein
VRRVVFLRHRGIVPPWAHTQSAAGTTLVAKKASAPGNKSQAIREALAANPGKSPKEITEIVTKQGFKVTPAYVSIIKYNLSKAGGTGRKVVVLRKVGRPAGRGASASASGMGTMEAALAFVQAAGGLEPAKQALEMLESIRASI